MKKLAASFGLVVLGAATIHAEGLEGDAGKIWNVSATLRGFYDDNVFGTPSSFPSTNKIDSFGFEISPSVGIRTSTDQTTFGAKYIYSGKYFGDEAGASNTAEEHWTHAHTFELALQHSFSPRVSLSASDSLTIGQEPDQLRAQDSFVTLQRVSGDNIRNYGTISSSIDVTPLLSIESGYVSYLWDYDDDNSGIPFPASPSLSGRLDRTEHAPFIDTRWHVLPDTSAILGYSFKWADYTGDEFIGFGVVSSDRNYRSHYGYAGVEHTFRPDLFGFLRVGVRYTDTYNYGQTDTGPYFSGGLSYTYTDDTMLGVRISHDFSSSDLVGSSADIIRGVNNTVGTLWLSHHLSPQIVATAQGTIQYSGFEGGGSSFDGEHETFYILSLNLAYNFNEYYSMHVGYNYDKLDSDVLSPARSYSRNRVYIGVTATY